MFYRHVELLGLKTISADQTEIVDIDLVDPISRIILDLRVTNGVGADSTGFPAEAVTSIQLVDGAEVLYSLTGLCAHALDIYCAGEHPRGGWQNYLQTTETEMRIALDFGRYLYDPMLALVPQNFRNLQLKVTHDISAGGMSPSSCKMAMHAEVFDEKVVTPLGFLMSKEIKSWSGTIAAHEYTDLPTDYPYRKLFIQGLERGAPPHWVLGRIKLSEDQDKRIIVDDDFRDILFGMGRKNAYISEAWNGVGQTSQAVYHVTPTMDVHGAATGWSNVLATKQADSYDGDGGEFKIICEGLGNIVFNVSGWAPHGVVCIPFGDDQNIDDWYNVDAVGSLKLDVTGGRTGTTSKVFVQQYRKY